MIFDISVHQPVLLIINVLEAEKMTNCKIKGKIVITKQLRGVPSNQRVTGEPGAGQKLTDAGRRRSLAVALTANRLVLIGRGQNTQWMTVV